MPTHLSRIAVSPGHPSPSPRHVRALPLPEPITCLSRTDAVYKQWAGEHGHSYKMIYARHRHSMWQSSRGSPMGRSAYRSHNHNDARQVLQSLHDWAMPMFDASHLETKLLALLWEDRGPMFQTWPGHMVKLLPKQATPEHARSEAKLPQPSLSIAEYLLLCIPQIYMLLLWSLRHRETTIGSETRSNIERRKAELSCLDGVATLACSIYPTAGLRSVEQVLSYSYHHLVIIVPVTFLLCSYPSSNTQIHPTYVTINMRFTTFVAATAFSSAVFAVSGKLSSTILLKYTCVIQPSQA
jgi:hypothetical protein